MEDMDQELQRLRGMVEQMQTSSANEGALKDLQERVAFIERQLGLEPPPSSVKPAPATRQTVQPLHVPDGRVQSSPSPTQPPQQVQITGAPLDPEEKAYRDAYLLVRRGSFNEAVPPLEQFIKDHPKSRFASDALYWLGEAFFAQGRHDEAVLQFDRVIKEFPGSKKELSALLRQGEAFEKMGDLQSARVIFDKLMKEQPHSPQARMAKNKLKDLPQQ